MTTQGRPPSGSALPRWPVPALLVALGAALPLSIAAANVFLVLLTAAVLASRPLPWRALKNPALYTLLVYWAVGLVCALRGMDARQSLLFLFHKDLHKLWVLSVLLLAFAMDPTPQVLGDLAAGFAVAAAIGIGQTLPHLFDPRLWEHRAHAFIHPVIYGNQMAWAVLGGLCFLDSREKRLAQIFTVLAALALAFSQTRGAFFGLLAGCLILALSAPRFRSLKLWGAAAVLGIVMFGARLHPGQLRAEAPAAADSSVESRETLWKTALAMFRDHPLTGVGPNNFQSAYPTYQRAPILGRTDWNAAHDLYLHQLAERGLLGAAALAALILALTLPAWRSARENSNPWSLWLWGGLAGYWVMNLTEVSFQAEQTATLVLFLWAGCLANSRTKA